MAKWILILILTLYMFLPSDSVFAHSKNRGAAEHTTLNTGQGANELYDMDQDVETTSSPTFDTIDTGQGANELYDMNQNVETTSDVTYNSVATARSATPNINFGDSNCTDPDINAQILGNCTATGSGAEDCELKFSQQLDGSLIGLKKVYYVKSCADQGDATACLAFPQVTTTGIITCAFYGTDIGSCEWVIDENGAVLIQRDSSNTDCDDANTDAKLNVIDGGGTLAILNNRLGQTETIICEMSYD